MKKILSFICMTFFLFIFSGEIQAKEKVDIGAAHGEFDNQLIIINKTSNRLAFFDDGVLVREFSVATGRTSTLTPEGDFNVSTKWECPIYYKTKNGPCESGNPLGPRWLGLNVPGTEGYTYGIHGNNAAWSIGTNASSGCVRMHNEEVIWLFDRVSYGARVIILNDNNKNMTEIAKSKGYEIKQGKPFNEKVALLEETILFEKPSDVLKTEKTIPASQVQPSEKAGNWYRVSVEGKNYWMQPKNYYVGSEETVERYLPANESRALFSAPTSGAEKVGETTGDLHFKKKLNSWYYAVTEEKELGWVKVEDEKVFTKEEFETFKEEQKKKEVVEAIKDMNPLAQEEKEEKEESIFRKFFKMIVAIFT